MCGDLSAQTMAQSRVDLNIEEIVTIDIGKTSVDLEMNHFSHFLGGNSTNALVSHVKVTSFPNVGSGYEVHVKASSDNLIGPNNSAIPVSTVRVEAIAGDHPGLGNNPDAITFNPVQLNSEGKVLLDSPNASIAQEFDVTYSIPADQASVYLNRTPGTYSTTVEYSVIPK